MTDLSTNISKIQSEFQSELSTFEGKPDMTELRVILNEAQMAPNAIQNFNKRTVTVQKNQECMANTSKTFDSL